MKYRVSCIRLLADIIVVYVFSCINKVFLFFSCMYFCVPINCFIFSCKYFRVSIYIFIFIVYFVY